MKADVFAQTRLSGNRQPFGISQEEWQCMPAVMVRRRSLKRGEILFAAGDVFSSIYEVHAGCFKTCVAHENGREQVSGFYIAGDIVGLDGIGSECQVSAGVALEDSQVNVVPFAAMAQLSQGSAEFQYHFHKIMGLENERGRHMMFLLGSMRAKQRVATFLLDVLRRLDTRGFSATAVNLCMSRDEIGSYLGLSLETVSRMFAAFKESGTLEVSQRFIRILDADALSRAAAGRR